jgi:hypothetical protein
VKSCAQQHTTEPSSCGCRRSTTARSIHARKPRRASREAHAPRHVGCRPSDVRREMRTRPALPTSGVESTPTSAPLRVSRSASRSSRCGPRARIWGGRRRAATRRVRAPTNEGASSSRHFGCSSRASSVVLISSGASCGRTASQRGVVLCRALHALRVGGGPRLLDRVGARWSRAFRAHPEQAARTPGVLRRRHAPE